MEAMLAKEGVKGLAKRLWEQHSAEAARGRGWKQICEEILFELKAQFDAFEGDQRRRGEAVDERLDDLRTTAMAHRLLLEAMHAGTPERLQMMCAAVAGLHRPDASRSTQDRVTRVLSQLEAVDVALLRIIRDIESAADLPPGERASAASAGCIEGLGSPISVRALVLAGCLEERFTLPIDARTHLETFAERSAHTERVVDAFQRQQVSELGRAVLDFLRHWKPAAGLLPERAGE